jgi:hypothetical protein
MKLNQMNQLRVFSSFVKSDIDKFSIHQSHDVKQSIYERRKEGKVSQFPENKSISTKPGVSVIIIMQFLI